MSGGARKAALAGLLVPGAIVLLVVLVVTGIARAFALVRAAKTDNPNLDALRWRTALELVKQMPLATSEHMRAMMSIYANETGGKEAPVEGFIGDKYIVGGPSIGPGQVYRKTAKELGLWSPTATTEAGERAEYEALASDTPKMIGWAVAVFKSKLDASSGDIPTAIRKYNGSGSKAEKYRANALAFADTTWGGLSGGDVS